MYLVNIGNLKRCQKMCIKKIVILYRQISESGFKE